MRIKKVICFIVSMCMLIGSCSVLGYVEQAKAAEVTEVTETEQNDLDKYGSHYAYDALANRSNAENRQQLYNDIADAAKEFWDSTEDLSETTSNGEYVYKKIDISDYLLEQDEIIETYWSFKNDNPIYYFVSNTYTVAGTELLLSTDAEYKEAATRQSRNTAIISRINQYVSSVQSYETDYDKIVAVHDLINRDVEYGYDSDNKPIQDAYAHNITGVLITGIGVCESYARTFQVVMNYLNIDNVIVTGISHDEDHVWNAVKLDDGNFYYVDCTWDDITGSKNYLLKGSYIFDIDHEKNTPDNTGVTYLYECPEVGKDDYGKNITLKKGNTVIGQFSSVNVAFGEMTDTKGQYVFVLDANQTTNMPAGEWPEVKEIRFEGGPVSLLGDCTAQSDIVISGIDFNTEAGYLESEKKNAVLNLGNHKFSMEGNVRFGSYTLFVDGMPSTGGAGVDIDGDEGSILCVNGSSDIRTDHIKVDRIEVGDKAELTLYGTNITANEITYGLASVRLSGPASTFDVKKSTVAKGKSVFVHVSDVDAGSVVSNGSIAGSGRIGFSITCTVGEKYPKVSFSDSTIPVTILVSNSSTSIIGDQIVHSIWEDVEDYKGPIINIGTTSVDKIEYIGFTLGFLNGNNELEEKGSVDLSALYVKKPNGDLCREYDENYKISGSTLVGYHYFEKMAATELIIPSGVKTIASYALLSCDTAEKITLPDTVTTLADSAICGSKKLKEIVVPSSVTKIGNYAFGYYIVDGAMHKIKGLKVICVKDSAAYKYAVENGLSIELIPGTIGYSFKDAKSKAQYMITGKQTVAYTKTTATSGKVTIPATITYKGKTYKVTTIYKGAFKNKTGITSVVFGKNITSVGSEAFSGCKKLKTVTLNKNLTKLGDKAFYNCKSLEQIKIGSKVKTIGKSAFAGCTRLKKVTLGTGLTTIGNGAFSKCTALTAITIPKNVKKIGKQAFYGCKKLKTITIKTAKLKSSTVGSNAFKGIYSKATIKVLKSKKAAYKKLIKSKGAGKNVIYK